MPLRLNSEGDLPCPTCGWDCTHVHAVLVAARQEDDEPTRVEVSVVSGTARMWPPARRRSGKC